jgi:SAM-dependent methyltransferase
MRKLNLGCGYDIRDGWVNLDASPLSGVDVIHDIEDLPLPFDDDSFDEVLAKDVLEHIEYVDTLRDLYRILKVGGKLTIQVPHFTSADNFIDPTHKRLFSAQTFDFFVGGSTCGREYYFDFAFDHIESRRINFQKRPVFFYNYLAEVLVNTNYKMHKFYEHTGLSRLFPATNISVTLVK